MARKERTVKNSITAIIKFAVKLILQFVLRTIIIYKLGVEYVGLDSLYANIISMMSLAELGIGSAIIYHLYKPVAENNIPKIKSLMQFYKKAYYIIALIILVGGLCVIPFMDFIIKEPHNIHENLIIIYLIFLFQTVSSYSFSYKRSIIFTNQKNNITNYIDCIANVIANILELIVLIITKSFILYLITAAICAIITNIVIAYKANKMYPYLKEKNIDALNKKEKSNIFKSVKALAVYQLGEVVLYSSDNIIISVMLNITMVGLCSNYVLLLDTLKVIFNKIMGGMDASVWNLNASEDI